MFVQVVSSSIVYKNIYICSMHRDRIIELCMPYGTLLPHAHVSGHKELCPTCWGGVAWAVAPPVGVVRPGLWLHVLGWCGLGCGSRGLWPKHKQALQHRRCNTPSTYFTVISLGLCVTEYCIYDTFLPCWESPQDTCVLSHVALTATLSSKHYFCSRFPHSSLTTDSDRAPTQGLRFISTQTRNTGSGLQSLNTTFIHNVSGSILLKHRNESPTATV